MREAVCGRKLQRNNGPIRRMRVIPVPKTGQPAGRVPLKGVISFTAGCLFHPPPGTICKFARGVPILARIRKTLNINGLLIKMRWRRPTGMDGFLHMLQVPAQGVQGSSGRVRQELLNWRPSKRGTSERRCRRAGRFGEKPMSGEPSIVAVFIAIFTGFCRLGKI